VIAASVDDLADAKKMVAAEHLSFPVGYGLDARTVAQKVGGFYEADPDGDYLHPANFILEPGGTIASATYSTGSVGRLMARDALRFIDNQ